jgi:DNA helicase HerA-like ATPase
MNDQEIFLGKGELPVQLLTSQINRHGLIAGATGTGKTVTLRVLAEGFSRRGIPVFMADVKGDLSGLATAAKANKKFQARADKVGYTDYQAEAFPVIYWDLYGKEGHPIRATVESIGPLLLARMMQLNDVQEGILDIVFAVAEDENLPVLDFQDLRSLLVNIAKRSSEIRERYGNVSAQSVGAIQRKLLRLEQQQVENFFGEPELELDDLMRKDQQGRGYISILSAAELMRNSPHLYSIFLMWLLFKLDDELPEQGDTDKPKLVFFFDEAHLLFDRAPRALLDQVEQIVRLIRSKGVGIYFVTQNPSDIPEDVAGQLGNRVQHALRAFTAKDQKAVRAAADTFRANPNFNAKDAIQELGVGEALVSTLDEDGVPTVVERALIIPPSSQLKPLAVAKRQHVMDDSPVLGKYDQVLDRDSAHERLQERKQSQPEQAKKPSRRSSSRKRQSVGEAMAKSIVRSVGSSFGRQITRAIIKSFFK